MWLPVFILPISTVFSEDREGYLLVRDDEYDDWWPRQTIQQSMFVHLVNTDTNCSLKMINNFYPYE